MRLTDTGVLYTQARDRVSRARIINIIYRRMCIVHPARVGLILFPRTGGRVARRHGSLPPLPLVPPSQKQAVHPIFWPMYLVNHCLGGSFTIIRNTRREESFDVESVVARWLDFTHWFDSWFDETLRWLTPFRWSIGHCVVICKFSTELIIYLECDHEYRCITISNVSLFISLIFTFFD